MRAPAAAMALGGLLACAAPGRASLPAQERPPSSLSLLIERYDTDREAIRRFYDLPMSAAGDRRRGAFLEEWEKTLAAVDFEALDPDGRVDYVLFKNHLRHERRELDHREGRDREIAALVPFAEAIVSIAEARRRMEPVDPAKAAGQLEELARRVKETREPVESKIKPGKALARRAGARVDSLRRVFQGWHKFYKGYDPQFTWWAEAPFKKADKELEGYVTFLHEKIGGEKEEGAAGLVGDPIRREALLDELAHEMIPYTPEELIDLAEREFAWCEERMKEASRELGFGEDWRRALEHVKSKFVEPGKQPQLIRDLAREAIALLDERRLVTIPPLCREIWRMEMMSPERQKVTPYFTGGEVISVSFPTDEMAHEQKLMSLRGNNIHFCRATVHHEIIPGHHLQLFMAERHRTYRRLFSTPFLVEGWALYWELLLWDLGFARSPEDRVGMLFWRMHRCARIIVTLRFHLEKMSPPEMVDFLVKRVGHELDGATAEVRRYIGGGYGPLYQCAYMLGGLQLRALHKELVGSGKMTDRDFHDAVLKENAIPIELIRAGLTGQRLTRDFTAGWRFAE